MLFVADSGYHCIRQVVLATGQVTTLAGSGTASFADGVGALAAFNTPSAVAADSLGNLFVADTLNQRVRKIVISSRLVSTIAGASAGTAGFANGMGSVARFSSPGGILVDASGALLLVADTSNHCIRRIVIANASVTTLAGSVLSASGFRDGTAALFNAPVALAFDASGRFVLVADSANARIRSIDVATGAVTTLAGSGNVTFVEDFGVGASFRSPRGVALDAENNVIIADYDDNRVRRVRLGSSPCRAGSWCPAGSAAPIVCPVSFYCNASRLDYPLGCPLGAYCATEGLTAITGLCSVGTFCPVGTGIPQPCAPGALCTTPHTQVVCPAGTYCPNATAQLPCLAAFYCPAGSTNDTGIGACPAGYFCTRGADRVACAAGSYSEAGSTECTLCGADTFQKYAAAVDCAQCPDGTTSQPGSQYCMRTFVRSLPVIILSFQHTFRIL